MACHAWPASGVASGKSFWSRFNSASKVNCQLRVVSNSKLQKSLTLLAWLTVFTMAGVVEHFGLSAADVIETVNVKGSDIVKLVLKKGDGTKAVRGQTVTAHYDGKLTNGSRFDSSRAKGRPFQFRLGLGQVIEGWDVGFANMTKGAVSYTCSERDCRGRRARCHSHFVVKARRLSLSLNQAAATEMRELAE
jgi:hypothetical protein